MTETTREIISHCHYAVTNIIFTLLLNIMTERAKGKNFPSPLVPNELCNHCRLVGSSEVPIRGRGDRKWSLSPEMFRKPVSYCCSKSTLLNVVEERFRIILEEGPKTFMDFESTKPTLPPFYDEKKFRLGQQAFYNNVFSMMIAKLAGLVALLSIETVLDVVMLTKQSCTACLAYRRYASTILHTFVWLEKDPERSKEFIESLKIVRKKHCMAFKKSAEAGVHKPTQLDMILTQFGFIGYATIAREHLGISVTDEEMEGLVHVWRVIGSMLGIEDKFNICAGTVKETYALCQKLLDEIFLPALLRKNEHFDTMGAAMLNGVWPINFSIEPHAYTSFTYYLTSLCATNNNHSIKIDTSGMSFYSWYLYTSQCFVLKHLLRPTAWWSTFFRSIFNVLMRFSIFLMEKYPIFAILTYGEKYAKVNIFRYHYD